MIKTIVNTLKLKCLIWVVKNLQEDLHELESVKKSIAPLSDILLMKEIMETQRKIVKVKKEIEILGKN
tara:strand:+ start:3801 stop:4004 length:204 start_codon:yes stop_codon:yes gene_type:complete